MPMGRAGVGPAPKHRKTVVPKVGVSRTPRFWLERRAGRILRGMPQPPSRKDVEEQLAEALPVLNEAALRQTLTGLRTLLGSFHNTTHQKYLVWLWALGHEQFGQVTLGPEGPALRVCLPDDGADLVLAVDRIEIEVRFAPGRERPGTKAGSDGPCANA